MAGDRLAEDSAIVALALVRAVITYRDGVPYPYGDIVEPYLRECCSYGVTEQHAIQSLIVKLSCQAAIWLCEGQAKPRRVPDTTAVLARLEAIEMDYMETVLGAMREHNGAH